MYFEYDKVTQKQISQSGFEHGIQNQIATLPVMMLMG